MQLCNDKQSNFTWVAENAVGVKTIEYTSARLFQNVPNPYKDQTNISYFIPENAETASMLITDVKGNTIREIFISERGNGSLISVHP